MSGWKPADRAVAELQLESGGASRAAYAAAWIYTRAAVEYQVRPTEFSLSQFSIENGHETRRKGTLAFGRSRNAERTGKVVARTRDFTMSDMQTSKTYR